jgi:hypothetical protein
LTRTLTFSKRIPYQDRKTLSLFQDVLSIGLGKLLMPVTLKMFILTEGVREQGAEENIWSEERLSDRRLEKTA